MLTTAVLLLLGAAGVVLVVARKLHALLIGRRGLVGRLFVAVAGLGYGLPLAARGSIAGYLLAAVGVLAAVAVRATAQDLHARSVTRGR